MRLLRGIAGRVLACGCLAGVYETYEGRIVARVDARGASCGNPRHELHAVLPDWHGADTADAAGEPASPPADSWPARRD
jgi:hypothetical protein